MALDVGRVEHLSLGGLGTETASSLVAKVPEVITPDLDRRVAILGAVTRVERVDASLRVVGEQGFIDVVREVSSDRDLDGNLRRSQHWGRVITLQATVSLKAIK